MVEKGTTDQYFRLEGLKQFRKVDLEKLFSEKYQLVSAYPLNKELRFVLENVEFNSPNENILIFVTLEEATDAILPLELMRGGQSVNLENLLEIKSATLYRKSVYIRVRAIKIDKYIMKSNDVLELNTSANQSSAQETKKEKSSKTSSNGGMTLLEKAMMIKEGD